MKFAEREAAEAEAREQESAANEIREHIQNADKNALAAWYDDASQQLDDGVDKDNLAVPWEFYRQSMMATLNSSVDDPDSDDAKSVRNLFLSYAISTDSQSYGKDKELINAYCDSELAARNSTETAIGRSLPSAEEVSKYASIDESDYTRIYNYIEASTQSKDGTYYSMLTELIRKYGDAINVTSARSGSADCSELLALDARWCIHNSRMDMNPRFHEEPGTHEEAWTDEGELREWIFKKIQQTARSYKNRKI